jgi:hypothetical protein
VLERTSLAKPGMHRMMPWLANRSEHGIDRTQLKLYTGAKEMWRYLQPFSRLERQVTVSNDIKTGLTMFAEIKGDSFHSNN